MRNVYQRWGPVLDPDLRMACGASTAAYCWTQEVNRIWDNYTNHGYPVLDSFLFGMRLSSGIVPLCITRGGEDLYSTPFFDNSFTNLPNTSGNTYFYIAWVEPVGSSSKAATPKASEIPAELPILSLQAMDLPSPLHDLKLKAVGQSRISEETVPDGGPRIRVDQRSGAVYIRGQQALSKSAKTELSEDDYFASARRLIKEQGWDDDGLAEPTGARIKISREPRQGKAGESKTVQKNVIVSFGRQVAVGSVRVPVFGPGGRVTVQMSNDGKVLNAAKIWRRVKDDPTTKQMMRVKSYDEAYKEALAKVKDVSKYKLTSWQWGYMEAAGNVEQKEMTIVFRFEFAPTDHGDLQEYPPQRIEVEGQVG
jgi:hypothetical protein